MLPDLQQFLETNLSGVIETETPENRISKIIEKIGLDEYNHIMENTYFTEEFLFESGILDFITDTIKTSSNSGIISMVKSEAPGFAVKTVLVNVIQPMLESLKIKQYSFMWFFLSYGMTTAITELGADVLSKKDMDFCKAFAKGAVKGLEMFMVNATLEKIAKLFGLTMPEEPFAKSIILNLTSVFTPDFVSNTVYSYTCGNNMKGDKLKGESLYNIIKKSIDTKKIVSLF